MRLHAINQLPRLPETARIVLHPCFFCFFLPIIILLQQRLFLVALGCLLGCGNLISNNKLFSIVKLDSESLTEMARLDGEVTTQIADHFVNLIQVDDPSNTFIHIGTWLNLFYNFIKISFSDYTKDTYQKRTIHATELGLGLDSIGWTFLLINRGINDF